jgi:hypothetical protein
MLPLFASEIAAKKVTPLAAPCSGKSYRFGRQNKSEKLREVTRLRRGNGPARRHLEGLMSGERKRRVWRGAIGNRPRRRRAPRLFRLLGVPLPRPDAASRRVAKGAGGLGPGSPERATAALQSTGGPPETPPLPSWCARRKGASLHATKLACRRHAALKRIPYLPIIVREDLPSLTADARKKRDAVQDENPSRSWVLGVSRQHAFAAVDPARDRRPGA